MALARTASVIRTLLVGALVVLALGAILIAVWLLRLNADRDHAREDAFAMSRRYADAVAEQLKALASDGEVTDQEIVNVLHQKGVLRSLKRTQGGITLVVEFFGYASAPVGQVHVAPCFMFTASPPLAADTVGVAELVPCPTTISEPAISATRPSR